METEPAAGGMPNNAMPPTPQSFVPLTSTSPTATESWSWGACMLGPFFLIAVRKYVFLWLYLLVLVPLVNVLATIALMIFLGMQGRTMGYESATFTSEEQREGFFKAIDHAGKIMFYITIALIIGGFALVTLFGVLLMKF